MVDEIPKIKYRFCDFDPPCSLPLRSSDAEVIVTSRRVRHITDQTWHMIPSFIHHINVGGATDGKWHFCFYSKLHEFMLPNINNPVSYQDLSSILDPQAYGTPVPPPMVSLEHLDIPQVVQLRPNTYHGGGLIL
jgi:hypothetical protein